MKMAARILAGLLGLILLYIGVTFMFFPGGEAQQLRLGLAPAVDNTTIGFATIRGWIGGAFLTMGLLAAAGALRQHARPFLVVAIFLAFSILGRIVALAADGSSSGAIRALVVEVVFLAITAFAFMNVEKAETAQT